MKIEKLEMLSVDQVITDKRPVSDIIDEWLETFDEWEEENIDQEIQPYRKRSEDIKISDQNN